MACHPVSLAYSRFIPKSITQLPKGQHPILILHCLIGCRKSWDYLAQTISNLTKRKVYTLDSRNHGESPRANINRFQDMALDVEHFLESKGISKCHLMGHSMGGRTAMYLALKKPSLVQTLTVVDVSPIQEPARMPLVLNTYFQAMRKAIEELQQGITLQEARDQCNLTLLQGKMDSESFRNVVLDTLIQEREAYNWASNLDIIEEVLESQIIPFPKVTGSSFLGPTRFIASEKPVYLKLEDHMGTYKLFPKAEISYIPGTSHQLPFERPQELVNTFMEFFNRNIYLSKY